MTILRACLVLALCAAPAAALDFGPTPAALTKTCADAKALAEKRFAALASAKPDFKSTFVEFQDILADLQDATSIPQFLGQVAVDKAVRDAGLACDTDISKYAVDVYAREPLYKAMKSAADRGELLEGEDARLVEKTLLDFKRSGLGLLPEQREKLKGLRQRLVELSNDFTKEVSETKDHALFTQAQMAGVPADMLKRLEKVDGKYKVGLDYPDFFPFMENSTNPAATTSSCFTISTSVSRRSKRSTCASSSRSTARSSSRTRSRPRTSATSSSFASRRASPSRWASCSTARTSGSA